MDFLDKLSKTFGRGTIMIGNVKEYDVDCNYNYDFFAQRKKDFYSKFSHKSILCQGKHWENTPLVTILITTYKRPELLRQALSSALNQKGFDDYQIIIADNEGAPIEEETPTVKVVKEYQDEKVIYYRHSEEVLCKMDSAVRLAKSPWIVFLHDDDLLAENHLRIMMDVVKKHKEIKFLGCDAKDFSIEKEVNLNQDVDEQNYKIYKYTRDAICFGGWTGWLGALISRKHYIAIGGMPLVSMGIGDTAMVIVFSHHFGTYKYSGGKPLYFYRQGEQQATWITAKNERWKINEYFFYKYVINKYHKLTHKIYERNIAYYLLEHYKNYYVNNDIYEASLNFDFIISKCGMPADIEKRNVSYYVISTFFWLYRGIVRRLAYIWDQKIRKSDVYLTI